mmetsp:Transcript_19475/g.30055  ORF Transcript_19475/g.30055 Transcript_19475/m.30055 type:complete len:144 (+) Transcript_19475:804-1235(+)
MCMFQWLCYTNRFCWEECCAALYAAMGDDPLFYSLLSLYERTLRETSVILDGYRIRRYSFIRTSTCCGNTPGFLLDFFGQREPHARSHTFLVFVVRGAGGRKKVVETTSVVVCLSIYDPFRDEGRQDRQTACVCTAHACETTI